MIRSLKLFIASGLVIAWLGGIAVPTVSAINLLPDQETCEKATNNNTEDQRGDRSPTVCEDSRSNDNPIYGSGSVVELVVNILSLIIGVAAVIIIIIAGIQYMLSTGDPTKVNNAKNAILYALVGLVIAVVARFVVPFILGRL